MNDFKTPPAQGSIDAGGLPPLPESKYCADDLADIFTADQMRAYVLADRAARQSAAPVKHRIINWVGGEMPLDSLIQSLKDYSKIMPKDARAQWMMREAAKYIEAMQAAPAPSEPVPQGVPEWLTEWANVKQGANSDWGKGYEAARGWIGMQLTAPTATSGGEAVADTLETDYQIKEAWAEHGRGGATPWTFVRKVTRILAPPPLPAATDAASAEPTPILAADSSEQVPPVIDELYFNAQRLRNVCKLVGVTYDGDDAQVDECRGALLGQVAAVLRKREPSNERILKDEIKYWKAKATELMTAPTATSGGEAVAVEQKPAAWMNPSEGWVKDAFIWRQDALREPQFSVPVYIAPPPLPAATDAYERFVALRSLLKTPGYCDGPKHSEREAFALATTAASTWEPPVTKYTLGGVVLTPGQTLTLTVGDPKPCRITGQQLKEVLQRNASSWSVHRSQLELHIEYEKLDDLARQLSDDTLTG